jgi:hypothetical protein
MATDTNAQYNQLAWQLEQLKQEYYNQGGTGLIGGGNLLKEIEFKQGSAEVLGQIQKIQAQMEKMEPTLSGNPQDYIQAPINVQNDSQELQSLLDSGVPQTDPRAQALIQDIQQQQKLVDEQTSYNNQLQSLRSNAQNYIKQQKQTTATEQAANKAIGETESQIAKLQNQKIVAQAAGQNTSAIDKQIATLQAQNAKEQTQYFNAKSAATPLGSGQVKEPAAQAAANAVEGTQSPLANGGKPGKGAPQIGTKGAGTNAGAGVGGTAGGSGTGTSASGVSGTQTGGGEYVTNKGILNYQGSPYTGEYQGKYYNQGKLETAAQVKQDFIDQYGDQAKFATSVPELNALLTKAINGNWSATKFATEFQNTQWAQQHPGGAGLAAIKQATTPELYQQEYTAAYNRATQLANQLGIKLSAQQLGGPIAGTVDQNAVKNGQDITNWILQNSQSGYSVTDQQIQQRMAQYGTIDPTTGPGGAIKQFSNSLQSLAKQYGVLGQYSPSGSTSFFDNYAVQQAQKGLNLSDPAASADLEQQFKTAAMATYKPYAEQIANGAKVSDLASPYINTLSSLLEVDPNNIQLGSATGYGAMISKAMMGDANGQPVNPYDFASQVRSQPEWLNTQNAHQTILGGVDQLIQKMGLG